MAHFGSGCSLAMKWKAAYKILRWTSHSVPRFPKLATQFELRWLNFFAVSSAAS